MSAPCKTEKLKSIWDFALAFYRQEGVEADCLAAQDTYGLDVTFLIFALYRSRLGQGFDATATQRLAQHLTRQLVDPLRRRRRALKRDPQTEPPSLVAATRAQLLAAELASEQTILQTLHLSEIKGQPLSGYESLIQCARAAQVPLDAALDALLKRLAHAGQSV
ncbi:TIGR02444 family protein [Aquidulcibacter paucihalophilus]|uniref:TIGR02444 family protein n=1 Tax=Aquidulcibacter paucihalophilus TaxID=1978549 RepID=UPI000A197AF3|nr:TIGR02444 family protein [Aquidulcibacter paucihalophilus]